MEALAAGTLHPASPGKTNRTNGCASVFSAASIFAWSSGVFALCSTDDIGAGHPAHLHHLAFDRQIEVPWTVLMWSQLALCLRGAPSR
jgi:hypothetical protein